MSGNPLGLPSPPGDRMDAVAIVAALVLIEYMVIVWFTGHGARPLRRRRARDRPGHPVFERWARVQRQHRRASS